MLYIIYGGINNRKKSLQLFGYFKTFIYLCIVQGITKADLNEYIILRYATHTALCETSDVDHPQDKPR